MEPNTMQNFTAELVGTAILVLLGNGVVANVLLQDTKGKGADWLLISFGWGMAVFVAVVLVAAVSGAHINPAVTVGLAVAGTFAWADVPGYLAGQMVGAALGATLVWLHYRPHYERTEDADVKLATFCTGPAIRDTPANFISEAIATFVLVIAVLCIVTLKPEAELGAVSALPVGLVVLAIGVSLGGTTGYAINPARDLGPRIMHALLPIREKRDSDWPYAWIPVAGPIVGGIIAALVYRALGPV
jgi:glycerol uptake facilitator protein